MTDEVKTKVNLNGLSDKGFTRFSVKADDTKENQQVHDAFKEYCRIECDNNYTQGLRKLLEYYQGDFKYEALWDKVVGIEGVNQELQQQINELKAAPEQEKDGGVF